MGRDFISLLQRGREMTAAEFDRAKLKIKGRMILKLNKMCILATKGNSLCQRIQQSFEHWMHSKHEDDMNELIRYLDQFDQLEKENRL
jgi:hypothetical protein